MRNQTVDIAKGMAGVLVVLGHALAFRYDSGWFLHVAHLATPVFVFLSGIFLGIDRPWRDSVIRKVDGLLKPYFVVSLLLGLAYAVQGGLATGPYLVGVLYATGPTIALVPLWFLPHLFICLLAGVAVLQCCRYMALPRYGYCLLLGFLFVAGQYGIDIVWRQPLQAVWWQSMLRPATHWPGLPWSLDVLPLTLAYLLAGSFCSRQVQAFQIRGVAVVVALLLAVVLIANGYADIDINRRVYASPLFTTVFVFCGIYITLSLSAVLENVPGVAKALAYIGRHFLVVLLLHLLVLRVLFRQVTAWLPEWSSWHVPLVFCAGLLVSVLLVWLVQKSRWLSWLLLPAPRNRVAR